MITGDWRGVPEHISLNYGVYVYVCMQICVSIRIGARLCVHHASVLLITAIQEEEEGKKKKDFP